MTNRHFYFYLPFITTFIFIFIFSFLYLFCSSFDIYSIQYSKIILYLFIFCTSFRLVEFYFIFFFFFFFLLFFFLHGRTLLLDGDGWFVVNSSLRWTVGWIDRWTDSSPFARTSFSFAVYFYFLHVQFAVSHCIFAVYTFLFPFTFYFYTAFYTHYFATFLLSFLLSFLLPFLSFVQIWMVQYIFLYIFCDQSPHDVDEIYKSNLLYM